MGRQSIEQAKCTECEESDENYTVKSSSLTGKDNLAVHDVRCECGEEGKIVVDENGIASTRNITHDGASWNEEGDDDE